MIPKKGGILRLRMYYLSVLCIWLLHTTVPAHSISCSDILREGSVKEFSKDDLSTLSSNSPQQIEPCLYVLGKNEMEITKAQILWDALKESYGSVSDIPEENLRQLGWIISGIPILDFFNLTISDVDTVASFGFYRNLSIDQLNALKQTIDNQWSRKEPEQLTNYDLGALRQILCAFNETELAIIHADAYRDAATDLSTLRNCPKGALTQLANLAVNEAAFGDPSKWSSIQVASIGCVMAGLSSPDKIPPDSMEGITPDIVKCLTSSFLGTMSAEQIEHLTTNAASTVTSEQKEALSSDQKDALETAMTGSQYAKPNFGLKIIPPGMMDYSFAINGTLK